MNSNKIKNELKNNIMYNIIAPLNLDTQDERLNNLQAALLLLLKKDIFNLVPDEKASMMRDLEGERKKKKYGKTTQHLVSLFQSQNGVSNPEGLVDNNTAKLLNDVLKLWGAFDVPEEEPEFLVKGTVRQGEDLGYRCTSYSI